MSLSKIEEQIRIMKIRLISLKLKSDEFGCTWLLHDETQPLCPTRATDWWLRLWEKATHSSSHCLRSSPMLGGAPTDCKGDMHQFPFDLLFQRNLFSDSETNFRMKIRKTCIEDLIAVWCRLQNPSLVRLDFIFSWSNFSNTILARLIKSVVTSSPYVDTLLN